MRSDKLLILGFALLLLAGLAGGGYWLMGSHERAHAPNLQPQAMEDPDVRRPAADHRTPGETQTVEPAARDDEPSQTESGDPADSSTTAPQRPAPQAPRAADGDAVDSDEDAQRKADALEEQGIDPEKPAEPVKTLAYRVRIAGRVMDEIGRNVEGAKLEVSFKPTNPAQMGDGARPKAGPSQTVSTDGGRFDAWLEFKVPENVKPLDLTVKATSERFAPSEPVEIKAADNGSEHDNLEIVMKMAATLIGRVVDRAMKPIEGAAVYAIGRRSQTRGRAPRALTDKDGAFRFSNLEPGTWVVAATSSRHSPMDQTPEIDLTAGTETRMPDIVMVPTTSLKLRILRQDGSPLSTDGRPVPVTIKFVLDGGRSSSSAVPCDAEGNLTIHRVPGDAREFTVSVRGFEDSEKQYLNSLRWDEENDGGEIRLTPLQR